MQEESRALIQADLTWLSLQELSEASGLDLAALTELVNIGVLSSHGQTENYRFDHKVMTLTRKLQRLLVDFDIKLDLQGLALTYQLLERIGDLESQLKHERLSRFGAS